MWKVFFFSPFSKGGFKGDFSSGQFRKICPANGGHYDTVTKSGMTKLFIEG